MNPMSEFIIPPEKQPHECCEIVIVSGDGIDGYIGNGMFERQELVLKYYFEIIMNSLIIFISFILDEFLTVEP